MENICILDYSTGTLIIRTLPKKCESTPDIEEFIESLGYKVSEVEYMVSGNLKYDIKC